MIQKHAIKWAVRLKTQKKIKIQRPSGVILSCSYRKANVLDEDCFCIFISLISFSNFRILFMRPILAMRSKLFIEFPPPLNIRSNGKMVKKSRKNQVVM